MEIKNMTNIVVEIGSHSVRSMARTQDGIFNLVLGESSEQIGLPSVFAKEENGVLHIGFDAYLWKYHAESYPIVEMEEREKLYTEAVTVLFDHIIKKAKEQVGGCVGIIVVVVPSYYGANDPRKGFIGNALNNNGISNYSFVSAHRALCLSQACVEKNKCVLVYDMGHSGLGVSILQRKNNDFEVLNAKRVDGVGGQFFDSLIYNDIIKKCAPSEVDDFQYMALQNNHLERISSYAKEVLSSSEKYCCPIPFSSKQYSITRTEFEGMIAPLMGKGYAACQDVLSGTNVQTEEVAEVLLWGGSCRIPFVSERCIMQLKQINPLMRITDCTKVINSRFLACKGGLPNNTGVTLIL